MSYHPTPWRVDIEPGKKRFSEVTGEPVRPIDFIWIRDADDICVALFCSADASEKTKARLFAAAPEMLEQLKACARLLADFTAAFESAQKLDRHDENRARNHWESAAATIAKATGEL